MSARCPMGRSQVHRPDASGRRRPSPGNAPAAHQHRLTSRPSQAPGSARQAAPSLISGHFEFAVHDDGTVTIRGYVSIPTDQAWFFTPEWLTGEREADEEIRAGRGTVHESADDMFGHLDSLGSSDA